LIRDFTHISRTEQESEYAGHAGASGRYETLKEIAFDYAFLMDRLAAGQ
jgi:protease II